MVSSKHFLIAITFQSALVILPVLVQPQALSGFISIDCGLSDVSSYEDETTGISYYADANFTESGENREISPQYKNQTVEKQLWNLRSFPEGIRNCYTLKPEGGKGNKYLIRARFLYGNFDNRVRVPEFDLYLGVELWSTVILEGANTTEDEEIIHVPTSDYIHVCLVNTGKGIPFISVLELRPLQNDTYDASPTVSLQLRRRQDVASDTDVVMRYKDDAYDRLWYPNKKSNSWIALRTPIKDDNSIPKTSYALPFSVMSNAFTIENATNNMWRTWSDLNITSTYYLYMHISELRILQRNQSREFYIYVNGELCYGPVTPEYLRAITIPCTKGTIPNSEGKIIIGFNKTESSTLPPLINAIESFELKQFLKQQTAQTDVEAISNVKSVYGLKRSWQGDPCSPESFRWDGLNCSYNANNSPRIVSLNLSSSNLEGEISPYIANLTMLQHLDLSNNNLKGTVPEFLAELSFLKVLNLKGNSFTGPVPDSILSKNGLTLSLDENLGNPTTSCSSGSCGKTKNFVVPLVASLGGLLFVFLITVVIIWSLKRRKVQGEAADNLHGSSEGTDSSFISKKQQFTYSEIRRITNNFEWVLGEGGFGKVYHGYLNGIEVAVKMLSPSSVQGHRQFHAELRLLLRVHHKNLTTLVGYCNDGTNVGLIYEYMAMGNLKSHLSGSSPNILSCEDRLRIASDTAQGLEYLHNGCKPPIVHRDVKSTNVLLNEKFQAKLSDFGLSKIFPGEGDRHDLSNGINSSAGISTSVAGTPGYLDPEYYVSNWLNEKSDVYSFGVLLLEIITARPVFAKTRESSIHIIESVNSVLENGDINSIVDPRLEGKFDVNTVWKAIEIALACVSKSSNSRPTMSRVAIELKECLAESTLKDRRDHKAGSKDFGDMISNNMTSESLIIPLAR